MMGLEALELEIETAWIALTKLPHDEPRTLYLLPVRRITWAGKVRGRMPAVRSEIGTYTRAATLAAVREDVFFVCEHMREAA